MTIGISSLLADLRAEHRNMALLLNLLEVQTDRLLACEEPDYDLLHDIMIYMTSYTDTVHHPKEDLIYAYLKTVRPGIGDWLERIEEEHRDIRTLGTDLRNDIEAIESGTVMRRDLVVADLRQYLEKLRQHMSWEERDLFTLADDLQEEENWLTIAWRDSEASDPLFGPEVEHRFRRLMAHIQQLASSSTT